MPASLSRSLGLPTLPAPAPAPAPPLKMQDDHIHGFADQSQGMISILTSANTSTSASALRRTLSADMSSKTWMPHSQSCIKKVPSLEHLHHDNDNDNDGSGTGDGSGSGSPAFDEIWNSIQREQKNKEDMERPRQANIWSSILSHSHKANEGEKQSLPPPYIHPQVKLSASSLSEKSLEICTESLGSETGSDGFSSYPASELCDSEQEDKDEADQNHAAQTQILQSHQPDHEKEVLFMSMEDQVRVLAPRYSYSAAMATTKKATLRSFPPPLPSLTHRGGDGPNLHMRSHRQNGRLVLEAVSVPSRNSFRAQREDGRLLLIFSGNHPSAHRSTSEEEEEEEEEEETEEEEEEGDHMVEYEEIEWEEEDEVEKLVENEAGSMIMENVNKELGRYGMINYVHKFMTLARSSTPPWSHRLNKVVTTLEDDTGLANSLPMLIPANSATTACLNTYVYSWRSKPKAETGINNLLQLDHQKSVVVVAEGKRAAQVEYLVPILRGCNHRQEPRKSLLFWEPHCIATS